MTSFLLAEYLKTFSDERLRDEFNRTTRRLRETLERGNFSVAQMYLTDAYALKRELQRRV